MDTTRCTFPSIYFNVEEDPSVVETVVENAEIASFNNHIISINDNGGKGGFDFHPASVYRRATYGQGAYTTKVEYPPEAENKWVRAQLDTSWRIALMSKRPTDVLLAHISQFPVGIFPNLLTVEGRAAWFSFAFWLRTVAAVKLNIDPNEIQAGFRTYRNDQGPAGEAFLCDQLENGAGYCRHLGQPDVFRSLLREADPDVVGTLAVQWLEADHSDNCDASCHRCLRDYNNMPYHPLLDWRLALDMAGRGSDKTVDLTSNWGTFSNPWLTLTRQAIPITLAKLRIWPAPAI